MMMEENLQSMDNLKANLAVMGIRPDRFPIVLQYNKRDLPDAATVEDLESCLNPTGLPYFEATAVTGEGVLPTLTAIVKYILNDLSRDPAAHNLEAEVPEEPDAPVAVTEPETPTEKTAASQADATVTAVKLAPQPAPVQTFSLPITIETEAGEVELTLKVSVEVEAKARPPAPVPEVHEKKTSMFQKSWA
jgi:hypothetical protein